MYTPTEDEAYDEWRDAHPEEAMRPWHNPTLLRQDRARRRRRLLVSLAVLAALISAVYLVTEFIDQQLDREVVRRTAAIPRACPLKDAGEPLVNSTRYPDGSLTCRYAPQRHGLIQQLNRPNTKRKSI